MSSGEPAPTTASYRLDPPEREQQILLLMAAGLTSGEMAEVLYLSGETVRTYRKHLLRRLGAANSAHAVAIAAQRGLLPETIE